jgi:hypothetical protein
MTMQKIPRFRTHLIKSSSSLWSLMMSLKYMLLKYQRQTHVLPQSSHCHKRAHDDLLDTATLRASRTHHVIISDLLKLYDTKLAMSSHWVAQSLSVILSNIRPWPEAVFQGNRMLQTEQHVFLNEINICYTLHYL